MCLGAEHTECRSAIVRTFVFIVIITCGNKCGMDSGVASVVYRKRKLLALCILWDRTVEKSKIAKQQ